MSAPRAWLVALCVALGATVLPWAPSAAAADTSGAPALADVVPAPVLAQLDAGERRTVSAALADGAGTSRVVPLSIVARQGSSLVVTSLDARPETAAALQRVLAAQPSVVSAAADTRVHAFTTDPQRYRQWPLDRLHGESVWAGQSSLPSTAPVVAVIDTGVQGDHPDLAGVTVAGYDEVGGTGLAAGSSTDPNGHGTHVAGIIGAGVANGIGTAGLLTGARVMPVRVLGADGSGWSSDIAAGMIWAVDHGAKVLSMSLGGSGDAPDERAAADYAEQHGALVVAAAGNSGDAANTVSYPCAYATVLCVGATTSTDGIAAYSTYGPQVDISAPGDRVYSTYTGSTYATLSGTSMATPYAAASAAYVWAAHPADAPAQVRQRLEQTADDLGAPGRDDYFGTGLVDPLAAAGTTAASAPSAPSNVSAAVTGSSVSLSWAGPVDATGYVVRRSADSAPAAEVARVAVTSWTDGAVATGTRYAYTVSAVSAAGESAVSAPATAHVAPAAPVLRVDVAGGTASVSWSASTGAATYVLSRDGAPLYSGTATSFADLSAGAGSTHTYGVTAAGPSGTSSPSQSVVATVPAPAPAPAPAPVVAAPAAAPVVSPPAAPTLSPVVRARDTIRLAALTHIAYGVRTSLAIRSTSGRPVSVRVSGPCVVSRGAVTAHASTGSCVLVLRTPASAAWSAATVTRRLTLTVARPAWRAGLASPAPATRPLVLHRGARHTLAGTAAATVTGTRGTWHMTGSPACRLVPAVRGGRAVTAVAHGTCTVTVTAPAVRGRSAAVTRSWAVRVA